MQRVLGSARGAKVGAQCRLGPYVSIILDHKKLKQL